MCVKFYRGVTSIFVVSSWIVVPVILKSYCPLPKPPPAASLTPKPATGNPAADTRRITVALTTQNMLETLVRLTNPGPLPKNWHVCSCFWFVWISSLAPVTKRFVPYNTYEQQSKYEKRIVAFLARCDSIAMNHEIATLESPVIVFILSAAGDLWHLQCPVFSHKRSL